LRATAAGESVHALGKCVNLASTLPVSVFGTENALAVFIDFIRSSKLIDVDLQKLALVNSRQAAPLESPDRSDITPITKGNLHLFLRPVTTRRSYSIWTRGARLRAMIFGYSAWPRNTSSD